MTLDQIVEAVGGKLLSGDPSLRAVGVGTDTRALVPGGVFVALAGERFDANEFLPEAVTAGAAVIVCRTGSGEAVKNDVAVVEVEDTLRALGDIAAAHRREFATPIAAITGSNGKTTTKEFLRGILTEAYGATGVLANEGNLNNLIGLPLTLSKLAPEHSVAVLEMGMNAAGEIARMVEIAVPDVAVITCVGSAHLEGLGSIEGIANAKGEIFDGLAPGACAVVNLDDFRVVGQAERFSGRKLGFGTGGEVFADEIEPESMSATNFILNVRGDRFPVRLPAGGRHNVSNALAAAAVALALGVEGPTIAAGLAGAAPPPMRMMPETLANGVQVINDCYNANPSSLAAALATLAESGVGRSIVLLGDMLELGDDAAAHHASAGVAAALLEPVLLVALGDHAQSVVDGALEGGLDRAMVAQSHADVAKEVAEVWRPGDCILVKGSRGAAMEKVVEEMRRMAST